MDLSNIRVCPKCGAINPKDGKFCKDCGYSFFGKSSLKGYSNNSSLSEKSVGLAVVLSLLLPGGGHYYCGNPGTGVIYGITEVGTYIWGMVLLNDAYRVVRTDTYNSTDRRWEYSYDTQKDSDEATAGVCLIIGSIVLHVIDVIHAGLSTSDYNANLNRDESFLYEDKQKSIAIKPTYCANNGRLGLKLSCKF